MKPTNLISLFSAVLVAFASSACSTSRWYDARYTPAPVEIEVASKDVPGSSVRTLASVLGVAKPDEKAGREKRVEMRLRFENLGTVDALVERDSLALVSADLQSFAPAVLPADAALDVPAGGNRMIDVSFPVPDGDRDWSGLNLRLALSFRGTKVTAGATFERVSYVHASRPDPYPWYYGRGYYGYSHAYWPGFVYCW